MRDIAQYQIGLLVIFMGATGSFGAIPSTSTRQSLMLDALIADLGSSSFSVREQAQQSLQSGYISDYEYLFRRSEMMSDPEIKARLNVVLHGMEETMATSAPPISLDIKDATLAQVVAALSKATGTTIECDESPDTHLYTLRADRQQFWEIFHRLAAQHPLEVKQAPEIGALLFHPIESHADHTQITRGFIFSVNDPQLMVRPVPVNEPPKVIFALDVSVAVDPRIRLVQVQEPTIKEIVDEHGHEVPVLAREQRDPRALRAWNHEDIFSGAASLGKRITVRGSVTVVARLKEQKIEIADGAKQRNDVIKIGDSKLALRQIIPLSDPQGNVGALGLRFELTPASQEFGEGLLGNMTVLDGQIRVDSPFNRGSWFEWAGGSGRMNSENTFLYSGWIHYGTGRAVPPAPDHPPVEVDSIDASGNELMFLRIPTATPVMTVTVIQSHFQNPVKLTLRAPLKCREFTLPFEFKDLPLPH